MRNKLSSDWRNYEYLTILLVILILSCVIKDIMQIKLFSSWRNCILVFAILFAVGVSWDYFSTWRGHWVVLEKGKIGIHLGLLPLEEYLFMFIVPFFILVVHGAMEKL